MIINSNFIVQQVIQIKNEIINVHVSVKSIVGAKNMIGILAYLFVSMVSI